MSNKVLANQRVTVLAGLSSGISVWANPALAELTALTNVSGAINWNTYDMNVKASNQKDDRTLVDGAGSQSRSPYVNFAGKLQMVMPAVLDTASIYRTAYNLFSTPRVELVVAVRYGPLSSTAPAAADEWTVFHVITDAVVFGENEVSRYYEVELIAKDDIAVSYIVPPSTAVAISVTAAASSVVHGTGYVFLSATYQGWDVTKSATWTTSDGTKLTMVHPGIAFGVAAGTATVTASYPGATSSTATSITIT